MARADAPTTDITRGARRAVLAVIVALLVGLFLLWRIDNVRIEQVRADLVDRLAPTFGWTLRPLAGLGRMATDVQAWTQVYQQNEELRRELQAMRGWREAAIQLEQKNAQLLALNNVRLNPRLVFVTGEVMADTGGPFRRSALVNIGRADGVGDGAVAVDGLGLVGRIAGAGERSARILFLTDSSSRIPVIVRPSGHRAILAGDNSALPVLDFLEQGDAVRPGDRVVTAADGGLFPGDLLIGQVVATPDGRRRVRLAADFRRLHFVRVIRPGTVERVTDPGDIIGPLVSAAPEPNRTDPEAEAAQ
jgi:rod shape-determining protein MreC